MLTKMLALMVTFIPYVLIELPSNYFLKKIGPRWLLPGLCVCWGIVTTLESLIQNYAGFIACRFFIGLCEGGVFPGYVVILAEFYRRHEIQKRIAILYCAASLAGAFGGLLAAAIQQMDGLANLAGWRWIFLIEGIFTVCWGLTTLWVMPSGPRDVLTFTPEQKDYYIRRMAADKQTKEDDKVTPRDVLTCVKEPHFIILAIMSFCVGTVAQGISYFTPSVVQTFGFSRTATQLLTVPPFMFAAMTTLLAGWAADRYQRRGLVAIVTAALGVIGCILNFSGTSLGIRYPSLFFLIGGIYSSAPTVLAWLPNNMAAYGKRSTAIAIGFMVSNSGGILGVWIYPTKDAPRYLPASSANLALLAGVIVLSTLQVVLLRYLNKRKIDNREDLLRDLEHLPLEQQIRELGDRHPDFKYTL
jgi:MFS family permease